MREGSSCFIAEYVDELLEPALDVLGGIVVLGQVGRGVPCLLARKSATKVSKQEFGSARRTSRRPYSLSKRRRRLTGSLAASRREVSARGVFAISRDHCEGKKQDGQQRRHQ